VRTVLEARGAFDVGARKAEHDAIAETPIEAADDRRAAIDIVTCARARGAAELVGAAAKSVTPYIFPRAC
jgi:hypothetical protein